MSRVFSERLLYRFWSKVEKTDDCWIWTASRNPQGYGCFAVSHGEIRRANRVAYEIAVGPIPDGLFICHHCDNPSCVRPDHLFLGTHQENMRDMAAKGRQRGYGAERRPPPTLPVRTTGSFDVAYRVRDWTRPHSKFSTHEVLASLRQEIWADPGLDLVG